jgi:hypothetical protein
MKFDPASRDDEMLRLPETAKSEAMRLPAALREKLIVWNPQQGLPSVLLYPITEDLQPPHPYLDIPIVVRVLSEITTQAKNKIRSILIDKTIPRGREIKAAIWLEKDLGGICDRASCLRVVKDVKEYYMNQSKQERKIIIEMKQRFFVSSRELHVLANVNGVYRIDKPGSMRGDIESEIEWPEDLKPGNVGLDDDWQSAKPSQQPGMAKGTLVSMDSRPAHGMPTRMPNTAGSPIKRVDSKGRRSI